MKSKTCVECRYMLHKDTFEVCTHSMTSTSMFEEACKHFAPPTVGDKIRQMSDEGIAAFVCGVLNDRREETFRSVLDLLNVPAESKEEEDEC